MSGRFHRRGRRPRRPADSHHLRYLHHPVGDGVPGGPFVRPSSMSAGGRGRPPLRNGRGLCRRGRRPRRPADSHHLRYMHHPVGADAPGGPFVQPSSMSAGGRGRPPLRNGRGLCRRGRHPRRPARDPCINSISFGRSRTTYGVALFRREGQAPPLRRRMYRGAGRTTGRRGRRPLRKRNRGRVARWREGQAPPLRGTDERRCGDGRHLIRGRMNAGAGTGDTSSAPVCALGHLPLKGKASGTSGTPSPTDTTPGGGGAPGQARRQRGGDARRKREGDARRKREERLLSKTENLLLRGKKPLQHPAEKV